MKPSSAASPLAVLLLHVAGCHADGLERSLRDVDALAVLAASAPAQGQIVRTRRVSFSGRSGAAAGTRVVVTATDGRLTAHTCTAAVRDDQTWSCAQDLDDRGYTWTARIAADPPSLGIDFVVSTGGIPAPTIDHTPSPTNDAAPILTGTADLSSGKHGGGDDDDDDDDDDDHKSGDDPGSLAVSENGKVLCTVARLRSAQWSCRLSARLADGSHLLTATRTCRGKTSLASNPDLFVVKTAIAAPRVAPIPSPSSLNRPTFSGTGEPAAILTVAESGAVVCQVAVAAGGGWSCAAPQPLADGTHTISATQQDAAGNTSQPAGLTFVIDTHLPEAPVLDAPQTPTSDPRVTFTGSGETGAQVFVVDAFARVLCSERAAGAGSWRCTPDGALEDGTYVLAAFQVTPAGNRSGPSTAHALVVDTVAPPRPVLDGPISPTRKRRPVLSGSAEPRCAVTVTDAASGTAVCRAISSGAGGFSCSPEGDLVSGTYRFSAVATDAVGNTSESAEPVALIVSDAVPAPPTIEFPADGAEVEDPRPVISGRTAPATSVQVEVDAVTFAAQVNPDGKWTVLPPSSLGVGPHRVSAAAMDAELNQSDKAASRFTTVEGGVARGGCASGGVPWPLLALLAFAATIPGRRTRPRGLAAALAVGALSLPASAQAPSIDVSLFRPASSGDGYMAVEGARPPLPGEGRLEVRAWSDFAVHPLVFVSDAGARDVLVRSRAGGWLALQGHLLGPLSLAAQVPVTFAEQGDLSTLPPSSRGPSSLLGGFGDLRLTGRLSLLREEWAGVDFATQASLELPTARAQTLTDDGRVRAEGLVALGRRLMEGDRGSLDLLTNAYFRLRPPREFLDVKMGNEAGLRAAVGYLPSVVRPWLPRRVYAELEARTFVRAGFAAGSSPAEWRLGATVCPARNLAVDLAGGAALTDGVGAPRARFVLGFGWSPTACSRSFRGGYAAMAPPRPPSALGRALRALPAPEPKPAQVSQLPRDPPDKQLVILSADRIDILEQVHFATNEALIEPRSHRLLDQVAAVLLTHPDLLLVQVEGHTDDTGSALRNIVLAQERAEAVKDYLVSRGVPAERLRSAGFGQGRPIATNATFRGRAANRRVAFTILQTRSRVLEAERAPDS